MANGQSNTERKRAEEESTEGASTSLCISPVPTDVSSYRYDVFLSFRGLDTRNGFADHLYHSLIEEGTVPIWVFRDDNSIAIGDEFGSQILNAIERTKISIPIISENYASSKWCLHELVHIMDLNKSMSHIVLPIFYKVAPSDVRHLTGNFGNAFHSSQVRFDEKDIREGQRALNEVSYLNGWETEKFANGHEGELIARVVKIVISKLREDFQLDVPKQLVGLHGHTKEIMNWIDSPSINARMIGIYGMGGIGKTTLAKCIYNELSNKFVHVRFRFLSYVRETIRHHGITYLGSQLISDIREDFQLDVPKQLVGLHGHTKEIMNWIDSPSINARMIGIYGMGGIGKTTLAKCIYNELSNKFVHVRFLLDVRETTRHHGITYLQSQLISDIQHSKSQVFGIDDGINKIKSRFKGKKALILLDDIDDKNQLDALAREHNWFAAGSMIIVTTRNEAVLDQSEFEVDYKYELYGLDKVHALLLFNKHAFRMDHSQRDFEGISCDIISTLGGIPLALQVVGSYLYKKMNRKVWEDVRKQLEGQPHKDVQKILQISYDALEDGHKQIFLDIVCFFIGEDRAVRKYAMYMWEDCGFYPSQGIEELKLRCLIKIGDEGEFMMHDQLRDLGRSIFCEGQPLDKCSGPWDCNYKGASRVVREEWMLRVPLFDDLRRAAPSGGLLSEIRWLQWQVWGSELPLPNLHLPKLSVLDFSESDITEDWEGWSSFTTAKRLRVLNLSHCDGLRCTPDLSTFTQLQILTFRDCSRLEHLHPSVGKLKSLVSLDLRECRRLKEIPEEVGELKDLEELLLDSAASITEIPTSIGSLRKLKKLSVGYCKSLREFPSSIADLRNLQHLNLSDSGLERLPSAIGDLYFLQRLDIWGCRKHRSLPQLSSLIHLEELHLRECHLLEDILELPSRLLKLCIEECGKLILLKLDGLKNLEKFSIKECRSIERLDLSQSILLKQLHVENCNKLVEIQGHDNLEFLKGISIYHCNSIERLLYAKSQCLKELRVIACNNLVEIRGLDGAKFLEKLDFRGCESMETLPNLTGCKRLRSLNVQDCKKLTQLRGLEKLDLIDLDISGCDSLEAIPELSGTHVFRNCDSELQLME